MQEINLENIEEQKAKILLEEQLMLQKAYQSGDVNQILKAENYLRKSQPKQMDLGKSILIDPFNRNVNAGYYDKTSAVSFQMLRGMSLTPIPRAIIKTRKAQLSEFTKPQQDKYSEGFIIRKKRKHYNIGEEDKLTKEEEKEIDEITNFILNCGETKDGFDLSTFSRDGFETFIGKLVEDSLSMDQAVFEVIRGRKSTIDNIVEFQAVDGSTYRIADQIENEVRESVGGYYPSYVQVIDGQIQSEFYPWELCFGIRNPQTNIRSNGYGRAELEDLINTVTDLLNAATYNSNYFRIGSNPKGILRVKNLNTNRIEEFRQNWMADMAGVRNAHKMPIVDADSMEFITTQQSNKDMEYQKYLEFLIKIASAIFTISPEEIGFPLEGTGVGGLGKGSNETELQNSKDKGIKPLLRFLQGNIQKYLVEPKYGGKYEFVFTGYKQTTERDELEDDIKKVSNGGISQQDFFRKYSMREPDFDKDIILNPIYLQYKQIMAMGMPGSNEVVEDMDEDVDEENPFLQKAIDFIDKELNQPT